MKRLKQILSKVLEIDEDQITEETSPDNVETWDSFNHLLLISEIENVLGINFKMEEIQKMKSYRDLREFLENEKN